MKKECSLQASTPILIIEKRCKSMAQSKKSKRETLSLKEVSMETHTQEGKKLPNWLNIGGCFTLKCNHKYDLVKVIVFQQCLLKPILKTKNVPNSKHKRNGRKNFHLWRNICATNARFRFVEPSTMSFGVTYCLQSNFSACWMISFALSFGSLVFSVLVVQCSGARALSR